ncbi:MAG: hypothetical protein AAB919_03825 [Patescibacteria group bacterium]
MRDKLEGLGYQVSYSAKYGDALLIIAVLIAATMLQRDGVHVPGWLQNGWTQIVILVVCIGIGAVVSWATFGERSGQAADMYHDLVIGPVILFFAIMLVPIIWQNARWHEAFAVIVAAVVWMALVYVDAKYERLNQRQWLVSHGFAIKGEIPRH